MSDYGDDLEYLSPSFDPSSLTVPRLRSILVTHEVNYPSSAKKADLIEIFNTNVVPKARRLLSARSRVKRSARGIEDVPSSHEPSLQGDEDMELDEDTERTRVESPPFTVRRTVKRTPKASAIDTMDGSVEQETPAPRTAKRTRSFRQARRSEGDSGNERATVRSPTRSTRKSIATPVVKREYDEEEEQPETSRRSGHDSPFTADNPFQSSGNSPDSGTRAASGERRRATAGTTSSRSESKRASSSRRKTDFAASTTLSNGEVLPSTKRMSSPTSALKRRQVEQPEQEIDISAGEEFTPEETAELALNHGVHSSLTAHRSKRRRSSGPKNSIFRIAPWAISLALLSGIGIVYRREKLDVGFCGVGRSATNTLGGAHIPEWADFLLPKCEPCPPHAYCYPQLQASCEPDFVLVPHPLNLGRLVPLPPSCEPDGEKAMKVKAVTDRAVEELRERNAKWECGELREADGNKKKTRPELKEPDLKKIVASKRRRSMTDEEFEELWVAAIGEITARDEIESGLDDTSGHRTLRSSSLARITLACAARRSLRLTLARHLRFLVALVTLPLVAIYVRYFWTRRRSLDARARHIASQVLDRLAKQAAVAIRRGRGDEEDSGRWVGVAQLRDDVLREWQGGERRKVWEKVVALVEGNANVRAAVREGASGEVGRCWEWIGAVDDKYLEATPVRRGLEWESPGNVVKRESGGEWEEVRPIY